MGRPKGSKNKPKVVETGEEKVVDLPVKRKPGRPKTKKVQKRAYTVTEKVLAARRETKTIKDPKTEEEINFNNRLLTHIMEINELATHADRHDLLSLKSCFVAYLQLCQKNGMCVTNIMAYAAMGMELPTFTQFSKKDDPDIRAFCQWVKRTCAMYREGMVSENKLNPVIGIFWQRNYDGLRNDTEQIQSIQEQDDDTEHSSAYKDKYKKLIGG